MFAAMEITTLARPSRDRFIPGFGHGVGRWMEQNGAAPKSSLRALEEHSYFCAAAVKGDLVSFQGDQVKLDQVQMQQTPIKTPQI